MKDVTDMKCEQYTRSLHDVTGCGKPRCHYFSGLHNETNAAYPMVQNLPEISQKVDPVIGRQGLNVNPLMPLHR